MSLLKQGITTKTVVARLGIDIETFTPSKNKSASKKAIGLEENNRIIGYVGRISKEKNISLLLEAFKRLPNQKNLKLLLVGSGSEDQMSACSTLNNCIITGFVNNVQDYLQAMDIFILPSLTETTSLATLEAMATGLPVITTKVGFIQNYLVKGYNGLFFPKNSPAILAAKMEALLKNKDLRDKLGENARKTVAYSFSWERSINKIKRILLEGYSTKSLT
ncbi:glycosyltransferase family 4 protein [Candidatus Woesearchaeota archaeon]|nr:glycosyltransferase family 4 protein [Candidatus Woesearchaeota archaeon]